MKKFTAIAFVALLAAPAIADINWDDETLEPGFYVDASSGADGNSWSYQFAYYPGYGTGLCGLNARILLPEGSSQSFAVDTGAFDPPNTPPGAAGPWVNQFMSIDNMVAGHYGPMSSTNHHVGFRIHFEQDNYNSSDPFYLQLQAYGKSSPEEECRLLSNKEFFYDGSNTDGDHWWHGAGAYGGSNGNLGGGYASGAFSGEVWTRTECIPAPGAALLGLIGLGLVGKAMRRFA